MRTPSFPAWCPMLAPLQSPLHHYARLLRRATLSQIEDHLAPALPRDLLQKPSRGKHSRERSFPLARTFWCAGAIRRCSIWWARPKDG